MRTSSIYLFIYAPTNTTSTIVVGAAAAAAAVVVVIIIPVKCNIILSAIFINSENKIFITSFFDLFSFNFLV